MSTSARRTTLHDLPTEIVESLLVEQPPSTVCAAAQSCRLLRTAASSPRVWRSVAARALHTDADDASATRAAADRLVCAWWAAAGALVRGVPVHFRRTFIAVRGRCGTLVRVRSSSDDAVFAMHDAAPHAPPPALEMDFAFAKDGPFPVDGMCARIVAAPVPQNSSPARSPPASPPRSPLFAPPARFAAQMQATNVVDDRAPNSVRAVARIVLNGETLATHEVSELCRFDTLDVHLPARLFRMKPGMNTLAVEYDAEGSNSAYWLKTVRMVPAVLPMGQPSDHEPVPLRHVGVSSFGGSSVFPGVYEQDVGAQGGIQGVNSRFRLGRSPPRNSFAYSIFERLNLGV